MLPGRTRSAIRASRGSVSRFVSTALLAASLVAIVPSPATALASRKGNDPLAGLSFRHIGPIGNRVPAVVGVPGDPHVYYVGAASGGVFKTSDGGLTWRPIFDDQPAASIGALAVAPSDPNVVWVGTGETFIRSNVSIGNGVYRSTDAGRTFAHLGLDATGRIGRIAVHPNDPDTAWVAALGHGYGPQQERGVYRTRDGGATWERVLFVDEDTGGIDVVMRPGNPRILYAATWQFLMSTSGRTSGGPGSGIWRSKDSGDTWERLGPAADGDEDEHDASADADADGGDSDDGPVPKRGLPDGPWGKSGITVTAADPDRVWALIETSSNRDFEHVGEFAGVLWRSEDGGDSWSLISRDNTLTQRPLYYTRAVAAPDDGDEITFLAVQQSLSIDGGKSITAQNSGWDHHDLWIDPLDGDRRIVGHDGGVSISTNRGESWLEPQLPIAQMYHVAVDDEVPYFVYGNRQDGPTMRGPSRMLSGGEIPISAWSSVGGCEVGFALPTPGASHVVWSGCYDGILERHDRRTGHSRDVSVWPLAIESWPAAEVRYRFQWNAPLAISPHDPETVYTGSQLVHRTRDGGQSWQVISPDLTTADPELMQRTGGLTLDDAGPTIAPTVFAIAESPLEPGVIWAGTNDGQLHVTRDGGESWADVTAALSNVPGAGLPPRATISSIEPSRHASGKVYVAVDRHQEGDTATYVFATDDHGASFRSLRGDLPQSVFSYAHCLREDPEVSGLLYLGIHNGLWLSIDDGASWRELRGDLPHAPVHWLTVQEHFGDLVLATYGRGFWILDDLTPVRELARRAGSSPETPTLLPPRASYRFRAVEEAVSQPDVPAAGASPPRGAALHYWLPPREEEVNGADNERGEADRADGKGEDEGDDDDRQSGGADDPPDAADTGLAIRIVDADGRVVRILEELDAEPGLHRVWWDHLEERTPEVKLRTPPREREEDGLPASGNRPLRDGGRFAVLAPPGEYELELVETGEVVASASLDLLRDPRSQGGPADLAEQERLVRELRADVATAADLINDAESLRAQIRALRDRIREHEGAEDVLEVADALEADIEEVEGAFFDLRLTGAGQDSLRWKRLLYSRLVYLASRIQQTDHRPTDQHHQVARMLHAELEEQVVRFDELKRAAVVDLNELVRERGIAGIVLPPGE
ncbi:MAG TPA: sialidase [Thermoanaerobaculia bacterium]|nr:sialidase [Thermoanaerobaculia bacterium]